MNKFREIIEFKSRNQREDFLNYLLEKGLNDEERNEIVSIIKSCFIKYNDWTLVLLIDLTSKEQIISNKLLDIYIEELFNIKTYYIKLSILDYIDIYSDEKKLFDINLSLLEVFAYTKKEKLVVRNQALLILIKGNPSNKNKYLAELKDNINKSKDYRTHIRLYNSLLKKFLYKEIPRKEIFDLINISKSKDLGRGTDMVIKELDCILLNE